MTDSQKLDTLKNIGPVTSYDDVQRFQIGLMSVFVESYDIFSKPAGDDNPSYQKLIDNISDIALANIPKDKLKGAVAVPSIAIMLEEIPTEKENYQEIVDFSKANGRRKVYEDLADMVISTRRTILEKAPQDYEGVFKIKTVASPGIEAYEKIGFNKLDIKPGLNSYKRVF